MLHWSARKNDYRTASNKHLPAFEAPLLEMSDVNEYLRLCSVPRGSFRLFFSRETKAHEKQ